MEIIKAKDENVQEYAEVIYLSEIGQKYYPKRELLREKVIEGMAKDSFYVAVSGEECIGVLWYQQEGMFHTFPYLHMIVVKEGFQNQGIGSKLMDFFERQILVDGTNHLRTKAFLAVGDFNEKAQFFYLKRGYQEVVQMKGLFRKGITEKIFMKIVVDSCNR